jgi:Amt family ammonium transporter
MKKRVFYLTGLFCLLSATSVFADANDKISTGDTAFMLVSAALVLLMTPALALFYGGLVRKKNVLSTMMHSIVAMGILTLEWIILGYSLSFAPDVGGIIGNLKYVFLNNVGFAPSHYAPTIPHSVFMIYQCMFAIITPALISGAIAERMKFSAYVLFIIFWSLLVYYPAAHWIWGGGWLGKLGVMDFAGGLVVHATCGVSALVAAIMVSKRKKFLREPILPHHLPIVITGAGLLWFGWFGFNAGSALSVSSVAVNAFLTTHISAATALFVWILLEWKLNGKPTTLGAATGAVAGLAAITPAAGFISPMAAIIVGLLAAIICYFAISLKEKFKYDDSLDVFGVHGVGGMLGTLCAGLFAQKCINGVNGLFFGNPKAFFIQILGTLAIAVYSLIATVIILKIIGAFVGLKVSEEDEYSGLDISQHGESAYN